jgi:hypothetical protein
VPQLILLNDDTGRVCVNQRRHNPQRRGVRRVPVVVRQRRPHEIVNHRNGGRPLQKKTLAIRRRGAYCHGKMKIQCLLGGGCLGEMPWRNGFEKCHGEYKGSSSRHNIGRLTAPSSSINNETGFSFRALSLCLASSFNHQMGNAHFHFDLSFQTLLCRLSIAKGFLFRSIHSLIMGPGPTFF